MFADRMARARRAMTPTDIIANKMVEERLSRAR